MSVALAAILLVACAPILSVLAASGIATLRGCTLNEAAAHPCVVAGIDIGELLAIMFVMGWLTLATVPIGALALLGWIILALIMYFRRKPANG
jgi:hypothetical protein